MKKILVLCTGNSCRSQMAGNAWRKSESYCDMKEDGIHISHHTSGNISQYLSQK